MFMEERLEKILDLIKENNKVFVKDLSKQFNVTESMIRKDLNNLQKEGLVERTYGGAILPRGIAENSTMDKRLEKDTKIKEIIAKKAFDVINDFDTIFLDISSTNYILAKLLSKSDKKITIITNMVEISSLFNNPNSDIELICIGGLYNKKLGGVTGSEAISSISKYRFNKSFMGICGINISNRSIYNFDLEEGNTKNAIISSSKEVYLLLQNEKFDLDGAYRFASLEEADFIITESTPNPKILESLQKIKIEVL
ncbi:MAG: DeoR/GlpR family DNA-binding transcription regulator [Clostridium chrysemydis]|uniref:DeoR/GlpR family DNA-binding transcription regulator n=1 Tax=Clostridium TaxID=1485 RepID=UPI0021525B59|nr:DeoR/GlpR family DNA-binding transcription regulator [Clostridium sp. LY3-2]MCR6514528.1 DeoR/GlpR family DNA-binding transcription regulator [Clostridium sp. LY3-2]